MTTISKNMKRFQIMELVQKAYVAQGCTDAEFAVWCAEQLGVPVTRSAVTTARVDLKIANNAPTHVTHETRLADVRALLEELAQTLVSEVPSATVSHADLLARVRHALAHPQGAV